MSTTYKVDIEFASKGDFGGKIGEANGKLGAANQSALAFGNTLMGLGSKVMGPIDAAMAKVVGLGVSFAKLAVGAGVGGAIYGVSVLNNELEKTQISMAAIFNANGATNNIQEGMTLAADQMGKMRKDAAELPGEFQDLANIMKGIAVPGMKAGLDPDHLRQMSAKLMAAGAVTGLPMDMVAREAAQLMEGRAGAHNVLGMRLAGLSGDKAEKFNKMSGEDRTKSLSKELDKYAPAIEVFKHSFEGISSTLLDNAKQFLGAATGPLFERIKTEMGGINEWFDKNKDKIMDVANDVGWKLREAFKWGKATIEEWWPAVSTFASNAFDKLSALWKDMAPGMSSAADSFKEFLKSPDAIDKIITVLKLYIHAKAIGIGMGGAMGALNIASQFAMATGAAAPAAAAMAPGAATAASGAFSAIAGASTGAFGVEVVGAGLGAFALTVGIAAAAVAGVGLAAWQASELYSEVSKDLDADSKARLDGGLRLIESTDRSKESMDQLAYIMDKLSEAGDQAAISILNVAAVAAELKRDRKDKFDQFQKDAEGGFGKNQSTWHVPTGGQDDKDKSKGRHPGGGGQNIQKVEIVVTSNQDPSRIARQVMGAIQNIRRNPKASEHVPNWSGAAPLGNAG